MAKDVPRTPATLGGATSSMWDNFARLTTLLAKVRVWFTNLTIYFDFLVVSSGIALSKPLTYGRHKGATFCRRGATFWLGLQRYSTVLMVRDQCHGQKSIIPPWISMAKSKTPKFCCLIGVGVTGRSKL